MKCKDENIKIKVKLDLFEFVSIVEQSSNLQKRISQCSSRSMLEKLIEEYKCKFTIDDLGKRSRDLAASYWPWGNKDRYFRKTFFENQ